MLREICAAVGGRLTGVQVDFGHEKLQYYSAPPTCIFAPTSEDPPGPPFKLDSRYQAIRTRNAIVDAHIWGCSFEQCEALYHNLVLALHLETGCGYSVGKGQYLVAEDHHFGMVLVVPITFAIPILDKPVEVPTTPQQSAEPPAAATRVVVKEDSPGANEAVLAATSAIEKPSA